MLRAIAGAGRASWCGPSARAAMPPQLSTRSCPSSSAALTAACRPGTSSSLQPEQVQSDSWGAVEYQGALKTLSCLKLLRAHIKGWCMQGKGVVGKLGCAVLLKPLPGAWVCTLMRYNVVRQGLETFCLPWPSLGVAAPCDVEQFCRLGSRLYHGAA